MHSPRRLRGARARHRRLLPGFERLEDLLLLSTTASDPQRILIERQGPNAPMIQSFPLSPGVSMSAALASYRGMPGVILAEPDQTIQATVLPNDPLFPQQDGLNNTGTVGDDINAPAAWNITTGKSSTVVAVIDTGVDYDHPDLYQNIWLNQAEIPESRMKNLVDVYHDGYISWRDLNNPVNIGPGKITDVNRDGVIDAGDILAPMVVDANGNDTGLGGWVNPDKPNTQDGDTAHPDDLIGWNFVANNNNPFDDNEHGTHVSGIIGAMGNNGVGVTGVDWNVQIMALKVLGANGSGLISDAAAALEYAIMHGAKITSNSYGYQGPADDAMGQAVQDAQSAGVVFVAAAGNNTRDDDTTGFYPADYSQMDNNVVTVAAVDSSDQLASFSNYGSSSVEIAAPGEDILSTVPGGGYQSLSGTSMATPFVAGTLALIESQFPAESYGDWIQRLLVGSDPVPGMEGKDAVGGVLDAFRALTIPDPGLNTTGPKVIASTPDVPVDSSVESVQVTFSEPIDPATFTTAQISGFTGPGGSVAVQSIVAVPGMNDTVFDIQFAAQSTPGSYTMIIGPGVRDRAGNPLDQDGGGPVGDPAADTDTIGFTIVVPQSNTLSEAPDIAIPDDGTLTRTLSFDTDATIVGLTVQLDIDHTWDSDLEVTLTGPDGQTVVLVNRRGGSGANFVDTVFDDRASTS